MQRFAVRATVPYTLPRVGTPSSHVRWSSWTRLLSAVVYNPHVGCGKVLGVWCGSAYVRDWQKWRYAEQYAPTQRGFVRWVIVFVGLPGLPARQGV